MEKMRAIEYLAVMSQLVPRFKQHLSVGGDPDEMSCVEYQDTYCEVCESIERVMGSELETEYDQIPENNLAARRDLLYYLRSVEEKMAEVDSLKEIAGSWYNPSLERKRFELADIPGWGRVNPM